MKTALTLVVLVLMSSVAHAVDVTRAVFSITSSAITSAPNLRVQPMTPKLVGRSSDGGEILQTFLRQAGTTQNLYLTKSQTVSLSGALCLYIEVDQDTKMYLNSETTYILLPSGTREVQCFK